MKRVFCFLFLLLAPELSSAANAQNLSACPQGFPARWMGDQFYQYPCTPSGSTLPSWLDGYFFCQSSGSYGNQSAPDGQKLIHMFDGLAAVAIFDLNPVQNKFTAKYYPTKQFHIWDFYNRDFSKSYVAWETDFSAYNQTSAAHWNNMFTNTEYIDFEPMVDFWKVGNNIVAGTETIKVGYTFDIPTASNFRSYPFDDTNTIFSNPSYIFLSMGIHERTEPDGSLYGAVVAFDRTKNHFNHVIFKVLTNGKRSVEGIFDYGAFDFTKCDKTTGMFNGNLYTLPGYMHSFTSTEHTVILPVTSYLFSLCGAAPNVSADQPLVYPQSNSTPYALWYQNMPLRFLVFNKTSRAWLTQTAINFTSPQFVSHQWNAYELPNGTLVADMISYDGFAYGGLYVGALTEPITGPYVPSGNAWRFYIDTNQMTVSTRNIMPTAKTSLEFSQFNHLYEGKPYKWGYAVKFGFAAGATIVKVNMDDPSGKGNYEWNPGPTIAVGEPWFVPRPGGTVEDDGVVLTKGLDTSINKATVYVLNASNLALLGQTTAPDLVPFGFHNRYYSRNDLGMSPTPPLPTTPVPTTMSPKTAMPTSTSVQQTVTTTSKNLGTRSSTAHIGNVLVMIGGWFLIKFARNQ